MDKNYAVIMAGGRGERFWPMSTVKRPKQVLSLIGDESMLELAVGRLKGLIPPERVIVVTSADLIDATAEAATELPRANIIGEPFGRDTAAAVALASAVVKARDPDGAFCILTADHIIKDIDVFQNTLREGFKVAREKDMLVTIGITPTFPSTGFGYIESGDAVEHDGEIDFMKAMRFVEKPDQETARAYIDSGRFFWNSGMFVWSVASIQNALKQYVPPLLEMADRMTALVDTEGFAAGLEEEYGKLERISIDYAIMEKADNIAMARGTFRWYDVGSWPALEDHFERDHHGNVRVGTCETIDSSDNIVVSNDRLTALIGVRDLVVVQAENATLICSKHQAQDVKRMVQLLGEKGDYAHLL